MLIATFPGQGSQAPGMGSPWRDHRSWAIVERASTILGRDIGSLLLDAGPDELAATDNTQVAVFVLALVAFDAFTAAGGVARAFSGHSLGEYTALVASGVLSLEDGLAVVEARGRAMATASALNPGTMAAVVGLADDEIATVCASAGEVWPANYNAPGNVVIAGRPPAVEEAGALAKSRGAKAVIPLPVGGAFHTPLMEPAVPPLGRALDAAELSDASGPVVANVDASPHTAAKDWPALLADQVVRAVRWRASLERLRQLAPSVLVEFGPGTTLTKLARRTVGDVPAVSVADPSALDKHSSLIAASSGAARAEVRQGA